MRVLLRTFAGTTIMAGGRPGSATLAARNTSTWGRSVCISCPGFPLYFASADDRKKPHFCYKITVF